jgi:uncharacterized protein YoxC
VRIRWTLMQFAMPTSLLDWMELIGMIVFPVTAAIGIYHMLKTKQENNSKDIDGLGGRVKELELAGERRNTRIQAVEVIVSRHGTDISRLSEEMGELRQAVSSFSSSQHDMKLEIIGFISERTSKIDQSVHEVDKRVAVLTEQVRGIRGDR